MIKEAATSADCCTAISTMQIRGAGAIGAMAGFAMALAFMEAPADPVQCIAYVRGAREKIEATRPTARNLFYATTRVWEAGRRSVEAAYLTAQSIAAKDAEDSLRIGQWGNELIGSSYRIGTHCNAGWLAFVDYGTALSPVFLAHAYGKNIFVYADETRPRGQGARLTAWELHNAGVPHAVIPDNATAHLMAHGKIDIFITGADRIASNGDTANKIGTLEKAILAKEYKIPFYIAAPTSTIDLSCRTGKDIPIEERSEDEVHYQEGPDEEGIMRKIRVSSPGCVAINPAFDVTPARYITGLITEKGIIHPNETTILQLFKETK